MVPGVPAGYGHAGGRASLGERLRIGVVGTGSLGFHHARILRDVDGVEGDGSRMAARVEAEVARRTGELRLNAAHRLNLVVAFALAVSVSPALYRFGIEYPVFFHYKPLSGTDILDRHGLMDSLVENLGDLFKELDPDDEELTRTKKIRRKFINQKYVEEIDALYSDREILPIETDFWRFYRLL